MRPAWRPSVMILSLMRTRSRTRSTYCRSSSSTRQSRRTTRAIGRMRCDGPSRAIRRRSSQKCKRRMPTIRLHNLVRPRTGTSRRTGERAAAAAALTRARSRRRRGAPSVAAAEVGRRRPTFRTAAVQHARRQPPQPRCRRRRLRPAGDRATDAARARANNAY